MTLKDIAKLRMYNQGIQGRKFKKPEDVVSHMGAMQAQDFNGALWAVALRLEKPNIAAVEKALAEGRIIRSWPARRTLHFVAREDARWMLDLMMPIALKPMGPRGEQAYGLTEKVIAQARAIVTKALKGNKSLSRSELYEALDKGGVATRGERKPNDKFFSETGRGLHILVRLAHEQLICFGPPRTKKRAIERERGSTEASRPNVQTFVLLDEWVSRASKFNRDDALKELVIRYFTSHGPAQIKDLNWWSGLPMKDIKKGIELAGKKLLKETVDAKDYYLGFGSIENSKLKIKNSLEAHLLPPFDEFMVAYKDRDASLESVHAHHINPGANGMFAPIIVINGQIVGTWRKKASKKGIEISTHPFTTFSPAEKKAIDKAIKETSKYLNF